MLKLFNTSGAFAALTANGSVVSWGNPEKGGQSQHLQSQLVNVQKVVSTIDVFAALTKQGDVFVWGGKPYEPLDPGNTSDVATKLTDVVELYATKTGMVAIRNDGEVVTWGRFSASELGNDVMQALNP